MNLRERECKGVVKIGVIEAYSNKDVEAIKPFSMGQDPSANNHADNVIKIIKYYVPNAEIHLVPFTGEGRRYLIDKGIKLVNVSMWASLVPNTFIDLSKNAFILAAVGNNGNKPDKTENLLAQVKGVCGVGAVDQNYIRQSYSSYGLGAVKTCAITGLTKYTGYPAHGTSYAAPINTGLVGQWYEWYNRKIGFYPNIKQTNDFIIRNSHDIWEDGEDLQTGHGLLRLPHKFKAIKFEVTSGTSVAKKTTFVEEEEPIVEYVELLAEPFLQSGRTFVAASDIAINTNLGFGWDNPTKTAIYVR